MSRETLYLLVLALAHPAAAQPAAQPAVEQDISEGPTPAVVGAVSDDSSHGHLTWTYPCEFVHADTTVLAPEPMGYHCDYMRARVKDAAQQFNELPTLAAQLAFLRSTDSSATAAEKDKKEKMTALLKKTDPKNIPADIQPGERLKRLMAFNERLGQGLKLCEPFLWPKREGESYLEPTNGSWPESWKPCMKPVYDRWNEIRALTEPLQVALVDKAAKSASRNLKAIPAPGPKGALAKDMDVSALAKIFDGGGGGEEQTGRPPERGGAPPLVPPLPPNVDTLILSPHKNISDLQAAPPPLPTTPRARQERNYFARGYAAGVQRLNDDVRLALWHATGKSTTIGDPLGKAFLIFPQKGPTCAVAAQYQAMKARGLPVNMTDLAKEGIAKGYYSEYQMISGSRDGGTYSEHAHRLLLDHGVSARVSFKTTPAQLAASVRTSGDALVSMNTKRLWNDPSQPDDAGHAVYVSGAEVDAKNNPLGFYINDTGTGEAARFIPIDEFNRAWKGRRNTAVLFNEAK